MKKNYKISTVMIMIMALLISISACSGKDDKKTAKLTYVNWEEGVAYTHLAKTILEEKMGYDVKITAADVAPAYASVAQGDQDAFMETWLPVTHEEYINKYKKDIEEIGVVVDTTKLGLVVPKYMYDAGVTKISDLLKPEVAKKIGYKITGIDAGAGVMTTTDKNIMPKYGFKQAGYKLQTSSGTAMVAALKDAINKKKWIVVTGWQPHSMFGYFDLKFLEEDKKPKVWKHGKIYIYGKKGLKEEKPELAEFLSKMKLDDKHMSSLMVAVNESKDINNAVKKWMKENKAVIEKWIPDSAKK